MRLESRTRTAWTFRLFVGPFLAGLVVFVFVPIGWSTYLSFFDARNTVTPSAFVGFGNHAAMLTNPAFLSSLGTFSVFSLIIVPLTFALSLALALGVHRSASRGRSSARCSSCPSRARTWWLRWCGRHRCSRVLGSGGQDLGRGSAGAVVLALMIALVTLLQGRLFRFARGEELG